MEKNQISSFLNEITLIETFINYQFCYCLLNYYLDHHGKNNSQQKSCLIKTG